MTYFRVKQDIQQVKIVGRDLIDHERWPFHSGEDPELNASLMEQNLVD